MPVVFCKPDALHGPHSTVEPRRAVALLAALADHCAGRGPGDLTGPWRVRAGRAATQITERAWTEPAFRGTLVEPNAAAERLGRAAHEALSAVPAPARTRDVLRATVEGLGFQVESARQVVLGKQGVEAVYAEATTTVEFEQVRRDLVDYLADEPVEIWMLAGVQAECVLQWWKTYVRHMLLDRRPGEYLLRNLVHVCDGVDAEYLAGLLRG